MSNTLKLGNGKWATGKDTLLSFSDTNNNYKPLPFSFSRASSGTVINKDGLIETVGSGEPRIDFKDNTKGALLLEPTRTNYLPKSERLDQWSAPSNATVEYGFPDPFGGNKAVKSTSSSTEQSYQIYLGFTSANTYNLSVYAKRGTAKIFRIDFGTRDNGYFSVNLETGESDGTSSFSGMINTKIEPLDNDWYRISLTSITVNPNYVRMGAVHQEGFLYMAFAQLEVGSYPTSIIPTSGSAVTRVADSTSQTVPDGVIGQTEGTLFTEFEFDGDISGNRSVATISSGGSADFVASFIFNNLFYARIRANNGSLIDVTKSNLTSGNHKIAIAYASNDLTFYLDGVLLGQNTSASVSFSSALSKIIIGGSTSGTNELGGKINQTKLYNTRLSNSELAALTS